MTACTLQAMVCDRPPGRLPSGPGSGYGGALISVLLGSGIDATVQVSSGQSVRNL
jgi:hypothetical protein